MAICMKKIQLRKNAEVEFYIDVLSEIFKNCNIFVT